MRRSVQWHLLVGAQNKEPRPRRFFLPPISGPTRLREPGDSNTFATHRQDRPFGKLPYVIAEQPFHEFNAPCCRHVGEPHKPGMRCVLDEDELSEILVHVYKDALLRCGLFERCRISRISTALARFDCVVPLIA